MKIGWRILAALLGLVFLLAGSAKLTAQEEMVEAFTHFGMPIWFMYFIGAAEVAGAIGLQIPKVSTPAAVGLLLVMVGGLGSHLLFDPPQRAIPALVLGVLLGLLIWGKQSRLPAASD